MEISSAEIVEKKPEKINYKTDTKKPEKTEFEKECEKGMSVEEFRAAALKHVNSLPWKK